MTEKLHFRSKVEKVLFYTLTLVAVAILAFGIYIYLEADPEALKLQGIALLITAGCVLFSPIVVFEGWLVLSIISQGASFLNVALLIIICAYINYVLGRYGLLGAWILFRKR